jgi:hypothetical protein
MTPSCPKRFRFRSLMMIGLGLLAFCLMMPEAAVRAA